MSQVPDGSSEWSEDSDSAIETIIQPSRGWLAVPWAEMARQRELLFFLIWRDIKVRYKQAVLGIAWVVLQPVINVIIFTAIFGAGLNLASRLGSSVNIPYPVYVFAALLPWQLISRSLNDGGLSLVNQQHLLTKIYFPRLFVPSAAVGSAMFDMVISMPILFAVLIIYKVPFTPNLLWLFPLMALALMLGLGIAYLLSALTVTYRDFRFLIGFMAQIWMWTSFIMIPVPDGWHTKWYYRLWLGANPLYGIVSGFRKALLPAMDKGWDPLNLLYATAISLTLFTVGIFYFRRTERRFADIA
jgi:lipopolysaccharide transport system permease protein